MIDIEIGKDFREQVERSLLLNTVKVTLAHLSAPPASSLSILITTDQQIQDLNQQYRNIDRPTDVLAFPAGHVNPEDGSIYLGDVIISYPRAAFQAEQRGHKTLEEIQLLIIHGILHLFDFDHAEPVGKQEMWNAKRQILKQLKIETDILDNR